MCQGHDKRHQVPASIIEMDNCDQIQDRYTRPPVSLSPTVRGFLYFLADSAVTLVCIILQRPSILRFEAVARNIRELIAVFIFTCGQLNDKHAKFILST